MDKKVIILSIILAAVIVAVVIFSGSGSNSNSTSESNGDNPSGKIGTSIGEEAPNFAIETSEGNTLKLKDFTGKKVLVITSTATWCPTCIIEAKQFAPVYSEFQDRGVEFLSVSIDPTDNDAKIDQFKADYNTPWLYTHPNEKGVQQMIRDYRLTRFEITYVIDQNGTITFKDSGITSYEKIKEEIAKALSGQAIEQLGQAYEIQGRQHIAPGQEHPHYSSNPPTSGWHYAVPAEWGIYQEALSDEQVVHNLEHGGIWVAYHPRIGEEQKQFLENMLASGYTSKVIVSPRTENDADLALAAWGRLLKLKVPLVPEQEDTIIQFIEMYKNKGPEFIPDV